jgi:hypothetical protein
MTSEMHECLDALMACASDKEAAALILRQTRSWKADRREPYVVAVGKLPATLEFEFRTWHLGEALRQSLKERRAWRKSDAIHQACVEVVRDAGLRRGRKPFFELIATRASPEAERAILDSLEQPDVSGHAIAAACTAKVRGGSDAVRRVLAATSFAWVRRTAKRYLRMFP